MRFRTALSTIIAAFSAALPAQLHAQSFNPPTLVVLGMSDPSPDSALAIYMKPGSWPEVVIAVPPGTTPEQLAAAFRLMDREVKAIKKSNQQFLPNSFVRIKVPPEAVRRRLSDAQRQAYSGYLASFPKAYLIDVPGVGTGRAVEVRMPEWPDRSGR